MIERSDSAQRSRLPQYKGMSHWNYAGIWQTERDRIASLRVLQVRQGASMHNRLGRVGQRAGTAGRLTRGSSLNGATDSSNTYLALHSPLIVLLEQDGADEADDGVLVGEDAHHLGPTLHLAIDPFHRVV